MAEIRESILNGSFRSFKESFVVNYQPTDEETRFSQRQKWIKRRDKKFTP